MDPIDREVLALRHFEQLRNDETALVLGLTKYGREQPLHPGPEAAQGDPLLDPRHERRLVTASRPSHPRSPGAEPHMSTSSGSSSDRNPVEALAEEFLDRHRRGERPTLEEYADRHPELADEIRDLFPALIRMEDLGAPTAPTGSHRRRRPCTPRPGSSGWATTASSARSAAAAWASSTRPSRSRSAAAWP